MERNLFAISDWEWRVPSHRSREGSTEWKGEIGDGIQDFSRKLFVRNVAFHGM